MIDLTPYEAALAKAVEQTSFTAADVRALAQVETLEEAQALLAGYVAANARSTVASFDRLVELLKVASEIAGAALPIVNLYAPLRAILTGA